MTLSSEIKLGEIAKFIRGINFKPDDVVPLGSDGSVGCMRTKNVQDELDCSDVWAVPKEFVRREEQMLAEGDILVSSANSWNLVGKCSWIPKLERPSSFGGFVSVLRANPNRVEPRFLYRWFSWNHTQALLRSFGQKTTNISNLNIERCLNMKLRLPPLPEQRRIAAILDQADALRAKRREALAQLDEIQKAIFIEMFGDPANNPNHYPTTRIGNYVKVLGGYAFKSEDFAETGLPVVRISNLTGEGIDLSTAARIPAEKIGKGAGYRINPGDILMAMSGATTGKIGVAPRSLDEPLYLNQRVGNFRIKDTSKVNRTFLLSLLRSDYYQKFLWGLAAGAAQPNISGGQLESATVALPPIAIQNEFEECVERLGDVGSYMAKSEHAMSELFQSIQHRAFRGEL